MPEGRHERSLALIGCGNWGKNLARNFSALGALHTICEPSDELREHLAGQYPEVTVESDPEAVMDNPAIRQVAIAAPAVLHYKLTRQALLAGKDVYVEKPFALTVSEGEQLQEMARDNDRILMVGHLLQYHPGVCRLQELVAEGAFGKVFRITSNRMNLGKVRTEENAFWSLAPHDISVILSLLPEARPVSVRCMAEAYLREGVADCCLCSIEFSNGVRAQIQVSWLHPFKEHRLSLIGEAAMAVLDDTQDWPDKLTLRRDYFASKVVEPQSLEPVEPLRKECRHFLDCCRDRKSPKTDAAEGLRVLQILEAAQASADAGGQAIELNP